MDIGAVDWAVAGCVSYPVTASSCPDPGTVGKLPDLIGEDRGHFRLGAHLARAIVSARPCALPMRAGAHRSVLDRSSLCPGMVRTRRGSFLRATSEDRGLAPGAGLGCSFGGPFPRPQSPNSSGTELPPPDQAEAKERRTEKDQTGRFWCGNQEPSNFPARMSIGMDIQIGLSVLDPCHQRCLGPCDCPARVEGARDEKRVVGPRIHEIKAHVIGSGGHSQSTGSGQRTLKCAMKARRRLGFGPMRRL